MRLTGGQPGHGDDLVTEPDAAAAVLGVLRADGGVEVQRVPRQLST